MVPRFVCCAKLIFESGSVLSGKTWNLTTGRLALMVLTVVFSMTRTFFPSNRSHDAYFFKKEGLAVFGDKYEVNPKLASYIFPTSTSSMLLSCVLVLDVIFEERCVFVWLSELFDEEQLFAFGCSLFLQAPSSFLCNTF